MAFKEMISNIDELEFVIFCIEGIAAKLGVPPYRVYQALTGKNDILHEYIVPGYDILHTQGRSYIIDDILEVMKERGVNM